MARTATYHTPMPDGSSLGYGFKVRNGVYYARFPHPTDPNKYIVTTTGVDVATGWKPGKPVPANAHTAAAKAIVKSYTATSKATNPHKLDWDAALSKLDGIRTRTRETYHAAVRLFRSLMPDIPGPHAVTVETARKFAKLCAETPYTRSKAKNAKEYTRTAQAVYNSIAALSIVWNHWIDAEPPVVTENPWQRVRRPTVPIKAPTIPSEDAVSTLFGWIKSRFPGWEVMELFVTVKALSGCRLADLCLVQSHQLSGDVLTITPDQDKTYRERKIPLPADVAERLHAIKGDKYLWQQYATDTATYRKGPCRADVFAPSLMYNGVKWLFRQYRKAHPNAVVKSHDLRKRAITYTLKATGGSAELTSAAIPITAQTAQRKYIDAKRLDGQETLRKLADVLRPKG